MEEIDKKILTPTNPTPKISTPKQIWKSRLLTIGSILLIIFTLLGLIGFFFGYVPIKKVLSQTEIAQNKVTELQAAINDKDLNLSKVKLRELKESVNQIQSLYAKMGYSGKLPYL
jgi:hypothetical protein